MPKSRVLYQLCESFKRPVKGREITGTKTKPCVTENNVMGVAGIKGGGGGEKKKDDVSKSRDTDYVISASHVTHG